MDKVKVQCQINNCEYALLNSVPDVVDVDISLVDLQASGDPDTEDRDVYDDEYSKCSPFYSTNGSLRDGKESDPVDNDLHDAVNLKDPEKDWMNVSRGTKSVGKRIPIIRNAK